MVRFISFISVLTSSIATLFVSTSVQADHVNIELKQKTLSCVGGLADHSSYNGGNAKAPFLVKSRSSPDVIIQNSNNVDGKKEKPTYPDDAYVMVDPVKMRATVLYSDDWLGKDKMEYETVDCPLTTVQGSTEPDRYSKTPEYTTQYDIACVIPSQSGSKSATFKLIMSAKPVKGESFGTTSYRADMPTMRLMMNSKFDEAKVNAVGEALTNENFIEKFDAAIARSLTGSGEEEASDLKLIMESCAGLEKLQNFKFPKVTAAMKLLKSKSTGTARGNQRAPSEPGAAAGQI